MSDMTDGGGGADTGSGPDRLFPSSPQVVGGDPSEKGQDGFPITNVGNDCDLKIRSETILNQRA